jgi:hypothetical protein
VGQDKDTDLEDYHLMVGLYDHDLYTFDLLGSFDGDRVFA